MAEYTNSSTTVDGVGYVFFAKGFVLGQTSNNPSAMRDIWAYLCSV